mmetsp:Transcript_9910/g.29386  ORF Transcript_9910/g.29386 Transcript_9910/m.29386 type:complete len:284 (+) Transcript_9910:342-1193(+)|eukprot:CAMPEP_0172374270 /NCGR_PEP_ID=MMETSP1060-20121228/55071_1 /TAXON_ID=37318 /ORGANISM="Pseudo-nitzschia pungens, Strain cf. cingulata" /LENGTH=283 /DNA_ID=CAMNT_0013100869 /DNA_START=320 /DNA_END=1171 /DNA_ORIENTATION=+
MSPPQPKLLVASSKAELPSVLCNEIVARASAAIDERNSFSIALSGGSLPKFLAKLPESFEEQKIDPRWDSWHVFLADERCVPSDHEDSNLKAIKGHFLDAPGVGVPAAQIYGIDDALVAKLGDETGDDADATTEVIAVGYEGAMRAVLPSESSLDLAVLGFGPDGHTCSLFPDHPLLGLESDRWVASIVDSPKPPPRRITLTMRFLNELTRDIIVCGAGASKQPIIDKVFVLGEEDYSKAEDGTCRTVLPTLASPPPYPCSMVTPSASLTWVVDHDAMVGDRN